LVDEDIVYFAYFHFREELLNAAFYAISEGLSRRRIKIDRNLLRFPFLFFSRFTIGINQSKLPQDLVDVVIHLVVQFLADSFGDDERNLVFSFADQRAGVGFVNGLAFVFSN